MSVPTPDPTLNPTPAPPAAEPKPGDPAPAADKPLGEGGEKALKAEREARTAAEKNAAALQKQLDEIAASQLSDLEKAQKAAADAQAIADKATADALRYRIAAKHSIAEEDAALFLTGSDEATLTRQAERLAERASNAPKPDLSQGGKPPTPGTPENDFASFLQGQLS